MELYKTIQKKYTDKFFYLVGEEYTNRINFVSVNNIRTDSFEHNHISEYVNCHTTIDSALKTLSRQFLKDDYAIWCFKPKNISLGLDEGQMQFYLKRENLIPVDMDSINIKKLSYL